jgi:hypothetical protein
VAFGVEAIMGWSPGQRQVFDCLGLSKNSVLIKKLEPALAEGASPPLSGRQQHTGIHGV